ncbi:unnamed protein product, partial [Callosobruchus maculatus]
GDSVVVVLGLCEVRGDSVVVVLGLREVRGDSVVVVFGLCEVRGDTVVGVSVHGVSVEDVGRGGGVGPDVVGPGLSDVQGLSVVDVLVCLRCKEPQL